MPSTINAQIDGQSRNVGLRMIVPITGINLNAAGTDVATITGLPAKYILNALTVYDASTSLAASPATLGLFTAAAGGGTAIVAAATLTALSAATKITNMTITVATDYITAATLYLRNVLANGGAATASVALDITVLA